MQTSVASTDYLLEVKKLLVERDDRVLFADLNFGLEAASVTQIEGPNGSGKTTLLRILAGLNHAYEGEIFFQGQAIAASRYEFAQAVSWLGHNTGVKQNLSPRENLIWAQALSAPCSGEEIDHALDQVGLFGYEDVPVQQLSAGQQRRVALARLYLSKARLWILDEPFTAIDKAGVAQLEQLLYDFAHSGGAVLLTTHHQLHYAGSLQKITLGGEHAS